MRKLTFLLALLFMGQAYTATPSFEISKEKLGEVKTKLIEQQKACAEKEEELKNDPFLLNIESEMAMAIKIGEISKEAGDQVLAMINLVVKTFEDVCDKNDEVIAKVENEIKSDEATSVFDIKKLEDEKYEVVLKNLREIQELSVNENVSEADQELLQIIGGVMGRLIKKVEESRAKGNEAVEIK
jgi:hypothetical protein